MDSAILLFIQERIRAPFLNDFFCFFTHLGDYGIVWIAIALVLLCFKKTRAYAVCCSTSLVNMLIINNLLIKNLVNRIRPYDAIPELIALVPPLHDSSFPSGHTAAAFAFATALVLSCPKKGYGIAAMIFGFVMGFSRLYVGAHYLSDVIGGAVLGILYGFLAFQLSKKLQKTP